MPGLGATLNATCCQRASGLCTCALHQCLTPFHPILFACRILSALFSRSLVRISRSRQGRVAGDERGGKRLALARSDACRFPSPPCSPSSGKRTSALLCGGASRASTDEPDSHTSGCLLAAHWPRPFACLPCRPQHHRPSTLWFCSPVPAASLPPLTHRFCFRLMTRL